MHGGSGRSTARVCARARSDPDHIARAPRVIGEMHGSLAAARPKKKKKVGPLPREPGNKKVPKRCLLTSVMKERVCMLTFLVISL